MCAGSVCTNFYHFLFRCDHCDVPKGDVRIIECGQSMDGIAGGDTVSFRFTNDNERNVMFTASNRTFQPILKIKTPATDYVERIIATVGGFANSGIMMFVVGDMPSGQYIAEMIPIEHFGEFQVNMLCTTRFELD